VALSSRFTVASTPFLNWLKTSSTEYWNSSGSGAAGTSPSSCASSRAMSKLSSTPPAGGTSAGVSFGVSFGAAAWAARLEPAARRSTSASFPSTPRWPG